MESIKTASNITRKDLNSEMLKLSLSLYNISHISRKDVNKVINIFNHFFTHKLIPCIQNEIEFLVKPLSTEMPYSKTQLILEDFKDLFQQISTEHLRFKMFEEKSSYIPPQLFEVGQVSTYHLNNDKSLTVQMQPAYAATVSLKDTLQAALSIPGVMESILTYMNNLSKEKELLSNVLQADLWIKKYNELNKIILPVHLYFDEFETRNPLGSHAGEEKLGGVYVSLACLPPSMSAKLKNIFVSTIFYAKHLNLFKTENLFKKTIEDLNFLSEKGLEIFFDGSCKTVYFECVQVLGDNLGMNRICGFSSSFMAKYFCRICSATSDQCHNMIEEDETLLREKQSYQKDVVENKFEKTGIKEECIFNKLNKFDITENMSVDIMHDVSEGIIPYTLSNVLESLIKENVITLDTINKRIESFRYNELEKSNKPRVLFFSQGKKGGQKLKIKQSASEMLCLCRYLGLMIGDLIPGDNRYWKLLICLRKIIGILMSPILDKGQIQNLKILIAKHNAKYIEFFGNLKPKMHIWVHYHRIIELNGPVVHFSSLKFERKNKELKETAVGTTSNVNLPFTIAIRHQLKLCYSLEFSPPTHRNIILGPVINSNASSQLKKLIPNFSNDIPVSTLKHVEILGNMFLDETVFVTRITEDGPQFGIIKKIFYCNGVYFEAIEFETINFNHHYQAFNVQCNSIKPNILINVDLIPQIPPCLLCEKKDDVLIATRYDI